MILNVLNNTETTTDIEAPKTIKACNELVGGLSGPSKMPWQSISLSASRCKMGKRLQDIVGSVCAGCYAMKNFYVFPDFIRAAERRFKALSDPRWVDAFRTLLNKKAPTKDKKDKPMRWHDSGDLQSVEHLRQIALVAMGTPEVDHWVPTREYKMVTEYIDTYGPLPGNVCVRLSAHMVDGKAPKISDGKGGFLPTSTVVSEGGDCPASKQGNKCLTCRRCWRPEVENVSYPVH